jgi:hypothetical protein
MPVIAALDGVALGKNFQGFQLSLFGKGLLFYI